MDTEDIVPLVALVVDLGYDEYIGENVPGWNVYTDTFRAKREAARQHVERWVGPLEDFGATADDVPSDIKAAIRMFVGHLVANREATATDVPAEIALGFHDLIGPYRKWEF